MLNVNELIGFGVGGTTPGSQNFTSSGTFIVPEYTTLTVTVSGSGGTGGVGCSRTIEASCSCTGGSNGQAGGAASFNGTVVGNGGSGGSDAGGTGASGAASGGDVNTTGGGAVGGAGQSGWVEEPCDAQPPGQGGNGGAGGKAVKTYYPGQLTVGASVSVVRNAGGMNNGSVLISWL